MDTRDKPEYDDGELCQLLKPYPAQGRVKWTTLDRHPTTLSRNSALRLCANSAASAS